jgi:HTH-type transcriptional regulator/antitoxin MqsA
MEKRKPTYDLAAIKAAIGAAETLSITSSALRDAVGLGFDRGGIAKVIQTIERHMFYKSMTTHADHPSVAGRVPCARREWPDTVREVSSERRDRVHGHVVQGEVTMATKVGTLPKTMPSPETGETPTRGVRPFKVTYKGKTITVDLPGYYPKGDGDGVHVGNDMSVVDRALRMLKEKVDGIPAPETIRKVRTKLRLSQRRAGALFRVGPNAFDKYERGLIEPSGPTVQLITILNRHPELVKELEGA